MLSGRPGRRLRVPNAMRDDNSHVPCGRSGKVHHNEGKSNMKRLFAVICAGVLLLESCEDLGTSYAGSFLGTFSFRSFDTLKVEVAQGTLSHFKNDSAVSGHWSFADGRSGELEGTAINSDLSLNLNPHYVDNNLLLRGTIARDTFAGTWEQIGFPGVMARGTFVAVRMR